MKRDGRCQGCNSDFHDPLDRFHRVYCRHCTRYMDAWRTIWERVKTKFEKGHSCVDCGDPATGRDHRHLSKLTKWEYVCHSCNAKRGAAKFPLEIVRIHRKYNREEAMKIKDVVGVSRQRVSEVLREEREKAK